MTRRIAVVVPPIEDFYFTEHRNSSLGARTVAGLLSESGCEVRFFNFIGAKGGRGRKCSIALPGPLEYLQPFLKPAVNSAKTRDGFFSGYYRFGPADVECAAEVAAAKPDAVFLSLFAFAYAREANEFARHCRDALPGVPLIIGGPGGSVYPEYFLRTGTYSAACTGEAEIIIPEILKAITEGLPNPANGICMDAARITDAADIFPVWHLSKGKRRILTTALSRGCPLNCSFCSTRITHGKGFRCGSAAKWLEALPEAPRNMPVDINLEDDNLLYEPGLLFELLDGIRYRFPAGTLMMENGIDFRLLNSGNVQKLMQAGMSHFNISMGMAGGRETGRQTDAYLRALELIDGLGGWATTYCIPGGWDDTPYAAGKTLGFLAKNATQIGISMFYPVPGIAGFEDRALFDTLPADLAKGSSAYPWTGSLTTEDLITAFLLARWINREHFYEKKLLTEKEEPELPRNVPISGTVIEGYLEGICSS